MTEIFYGKHRKTALAIYLVLLVLWLLFIFSNSLASAPESSEQSGRVVEFIQKIAELVDPEAIVDPAAVRTSAHFIEFFVLGGLYAVGGFFFRAGRAPLFCYTLSLSLLTAVIDETLQLFSEGRGSEISDVWVDFSGAFIAHMLVVIIYCLYKLKKKNN